jgi:hypothetical protein
LLSLQGGASHHFIWQIHARATLLDGGRPKFGALTTIVDFEEQIIVWRPWLARSWICALFVALLAVVVIIYIFEQTYHDVGRVVHFLLLVIDLNHSLVSALRNRKQWRLVICVALLHCWQVNWVNVWLRRFFHKSVGFGLIVAFMEHFHAARKVINHVRLQ